MNNAYHDDDVKAVPLVDASNAFFCLNHRVSLRNTSAPHWLQFISTRKPSNHFMDGLLLLSLEGTTLGDPLGMPMYAIDICPLIHKVECDVKEVWNTDDATAAGQLKNILYVNGGTTWSSMVLTLDVSSIPPKLVVKESHHLDAIAYSADVTITTAGKSHLGAALGTEIFVHEFVNGKLQQRVEEIKHLSSTTQTQPHAAYPAFVHVLSTKWTYLSRTIPNIEELVQPLEDAIRHHFIPVLTRRAPPSKKEICLHYLAALGELAFAILQKVPVLNILLSFVILRCTPVFILLVTT